MKHYRILPRWLAVSLGLSLTAAAQASTWTNGNGNYSLGTNWDTGLVPCFEILPVGNDAVIDIAGVTVTQDVPVCSVIGLTLGAGVSLSLAPATTYSAGTANIGGVISGNGGDLVAMNSVFTGTAARLAATQGSQIELDATTVPATGVPPGGVALFSASGAGSALSLTSVADIDASFNSASGNVHSHDVSASDGGFIDLSGLNAVSVPVDREDRLSFLVSDTAVIDLGSLSTSTGTGQVLFDVSDNGSLSLPALTALEGGRFFASSGGLLSAAMSTWTLDSVFLFNNNYVLISASDAGSEVDLSGLTSLDAGFNSGNGAVQTQSIVAAAGGHVDLSGLTTVSVPADREDRVSFVVNDTGSMNLDGLSSSSGTGQINFNVTDGANLNLPALDFLAGGRFFASGGGQLAASASAWTLDSTALFNNNYILVSATNTGSVLDLSGMTSLNAAFNSSNGAVQWHSITASDGGGVDLSGLTAVIVPVDIEDRVNFEVSDSGTVNLDSLSTANGGGQVLFDVDNGGSLTLPALSFVQGGRFFAASGGQLRAIATAWTLDASALFNNNYLLISASNPGTLLDLSGMLNFDASFNSSNGAVQTHTVEVTDNAALDLSGLASIVAPVDIEDHLAFRVSDNGTLALAPLSNVTGTGRVSVIIDAAGATVAFPNSLDASARISVLANADSLVGVVGDARFQHVDESAFNLEVARVSVQGASPLTLELGGNDEGTTPTTSPNFGFGQLIVGSAVQTTTALLVDRVDNGNGFDLCGPGGESLYLYGFDAGPDVDGLRILNGSTLDLGGYNLYAAIGGVLIHINSLLTPGVPFPFDDGFIEGGDPPDTDGDGVIDSLDNCVLDANPGQEDSDGDGYGNACDADLNDDMVVNAVDLGLLKLAFFSTPGAGNWNPDSDFNSDGVVNVIDLGILKSRFFGPPGPSCANP